MLTIAVPVYNEGKYITELLEQLVKLPYSIFISDNASTDETETICREFQKEYENIDYYRHKSNIGALNNYKFCVENATTKYYMYVGGHDLISHSYIEELLKILINYENIALAYSPVQYFDYINMKYEYTYHNYLSSKLPSVRILALFKHLSDCSLFYGIHNTKILKEAFQDSSEYLDKIGSDHVILCNIAKYGRFAYVPSVEFSRRQNREIENPIETTIRYLNFFYKQRINLDNIYFDFTEGMREGQLDALRSLDFEGDEISKAFFVEIGESILVNRFQSLIPEASYFEYLSKYIIKNGRNIFSDYIQGKQLAIFGTGRISKMLHEQLEEKNNIVCFIDNNVEKEEKIMRENELSQINAAIDMIIVSVEGVHDMEIIKRLKGKCNVPVLSWKSFILYNEYEKKLL